MIFLIFFQTIVFAAQVGSSSAVIDCGSFCRQYGTIVGSHTALTGRSGNWSATDDSICSELGVPTAATSLNLPANSTIALPTAFSSSALFQQCSLPFGATSYSALQAIGLNNTAAQCGRLGAWKTQCQYENSQVEVDCIAYNQMVGGQGAAKNTDEVLMGLDITTAAICGTVCMTEALSGGWGDVACGISATTAGTVELVNAVKMTSGSSLMDQIALGGAALGTTAGGITSLSGAVKLFQPQTPQTSAHAPATPVETDTAPSNHTEPPNKIASKSSSISKQACAAAAIFAAMAGVRAYEITIIQQAAQSQCSTIQSLASPSNAASMTPNPAATFSITQTSVASTPSNGSGSNSSSGATAGTTQSPTGTQIANFQTCLRGSSNISVISGCAASNNIPLSSIQQAAGADAQALNQTGVLPQMLAQVPNLGSLTANAIKNGPAATFAGMSGSLGEPMASALGGLAQAAQKDGSFLAKSMHMQSTYAGGGARTEESTPDPFNPLAMFQKNDQAQAGQSEFQAFAGTQYDIWHEGSQLSIFEIVTNHINTVAPQFGE